MNTNGRTMPIEMTTTLDRYISLATEHGEATENGNSDDANSAYKELEAVFNEIVQCGQREQLVPLLSHENLAVRAKAAFHTYVLDSCRAESVLESVSANPGLVGFSAGMALMQLRNGGLKPK